MTAKALEDPNGKAVERDRKIRDEILRRVRARIAEEVEK